MSEFEQYRSLFVAESRENHENLVNNLLVLEKGADQNAIDEIFRSIHTLKGASASMGFADMERLCHTMEDALQLIRKRQCRDVRGPGKCAPFLHRSDRGDARRHRGRRGLILQKPRQTGTCIACLAAAAGSDVPEKKRGHGPHKIEAVIPEELPPEKSPMQDAGTEYAMTIVVAPDCMMKDVRALIAIQNLEALGTIRSMQPSKEEIDEGEFDGTIHLTVASDAGEEAIRTAAQGTEIATVEIRVPEEQMAVQAEPVAGKRPLEPDRKQSSAPEKNREIKNLRVDITQLDHIMNLVEDLVINRGRLKQIADDDKIKEMDEAISMVERSVSNSRT